MSRIGEIAEILSIPSQKRRGSDGRGESGAQDYKSRHREAVKARRGGIRHRLDVSVKSPPSIVAESFLAALTDGTKFLVPIENKTSGQNFGTQSSLDPYLHLEVRETGDCQ